MFQTAGPSRCAGVFVLLLVSLCGVGSAGAQDALHGFVTGDAARAFDHWQTAMQALLERDEERADAGFEQLLDLEPSPLRVALLADYTVRRTAAGGAVLLFEQDLEAGALGPAAEDVAELLVTGREQMNELDDGFYFSQLGRFDIAAANFQALLAQDPDPVGVLEFTERSPQRRTILLHALDNPLVADSARQIFKLLDQAELIIKQDPTRIRTNIERLAGPPRGFENAVDALAASGEYAIPFLIEYLREPASNDLLHAMQRALPMIDRPALNPLVMALQVPDDVTKRYVIEALGKLGYSQAVPYLLKLAGNEHTSPEIRQAVEDALAALRARGVSIPAERMAAEAFLNLAEGYYADRSSLAADPRIDTANVWYWREGILVNVPVPTPIFNEIMCMRCCEEALRQKPDLKPALSLWLAANFRRVAQLPVGEMDHTRPDNYPSAVYFAQSAGPEYCLLALDRAVQDGDPAVALGTIAALRTTAGPASLTSGPDDRLPLAAALSFPDRMVRIQAALTLGRARPQEEFPNYQNLMPALIEALMLHGGARHALVVDPNMTSGNAVAAVLRDEGYAVHVDTSLAAGLRYVREELPGIDVIFLATDMAQPDVRGALQQLSEEYRFAATPVVLIAKPGTVELARKLARTHVRVEQVAAQAGANEMEGAIAAVSQAVGSQAITPAVGTLLAQDAAEVLRLLAMTRNPVFEVSAAETALLTTFGGTESEALRFVVAEVLGYLGTPAAQAVIAEVALDEAEAVETRVKMFAALAEAAKWRGNQLSDDLLERVISTAKDAEDLTIREAASQALGALNVPGDPASSIIRNQYRG